jgi:predicted permease
MRRVFRIPFKRANVARDIDDEIAFHVDMTEQRLVAGGMTIEAARERAMKQFGSVEPVRNDCITLDTQRERAASRVKLLSEVQQDVSYAFRTLRRNVGFTAVIVGALALGIGANTAIFTLIDAVVVRNLPVSHPEQLVVIGDPTLVNSFGEGTPHTDALSYPLYKDIQSHAGRFTGVLATGRAGRLDMLVDGANAELEHPRGRFVSGNYFTVLGVPSYRGRVFDGSEDRTLGGAPVATISHAYWTRRFQQDPSVVGRTVVVNDNRFAIIGVTPPSFTGEVVGESPDIWLPLSMYDVMHPYERALETRNSSWLLLLGRLEPGVTLEQARQELTAFIPRTIVANATGSTGATFLARKRPVFVSSGAKGFSEIRATFEAPLFTLMIGVALLLCIICTNVANLLLARAVARGREMAVRLALGAERSRLVRQLLTESALLAVIAAGAGLLIALWGSRGLLMLASDGAPIPLELTVDASMLAFTILVSFGAVALFGLAPALRASRVDYATTLRASGRAVTSGQFGSRGRRASLGSLLIAGQVALSVVLLVGAAMLTRSLRNLQSVDVGLDRDHLVILNVDVNARGYRGVRLAELTRGLRERLAAVPGVSAVAYSENGIFLGSDWSSEVGIPGVTLPTAEDSSAATDNVGPGYLRAIGGRLLAGRDIEMADEQQAHRVAVVNNAFASYYFHNVNAVGKYFYIRDTVAIEIVGVAADIRDHHLDVAARRRAYSPYMPTDTLFTNPTELRFAVRTTGDPRGVVENVRQAVAAVDPLLPIDRNEPLSTLMRQSIREERLVARLASVFGVLALLLASVGLYGIMTYAITRRTGEIGLRTALGAQRSDIMWLVLSGALRLVGAGIVVGVPLALAASRLLRGQLHDVPPMDSGSIAAALIVLAASAVVAALVPALRASRVSPLVALQGD